MVMQRFGELPRRGPDLPMCATIYDDDEEENEENDNEYIEQI